MNKWKNQRTEKRKTEMENKKRREVTKLKKNGKN